jgi:hypothetical protein
MWSSNFAVEGSFRSATTWREARYPSLTPCLVQERVVCKRLRCASTCFHRIPPSFPREKKG